MPDVHSNRQETIRADRLNKDRLIMYKKYELFNSETYLMYL